MPLVGPVGHSVCATSGKVVRLPLCVSRGGGWRSCTSDRILPHYPISICKSRFVQAISLEQ
eukprot:364941-Chlamydomonas_euryale.AAC.3